MAQRICERSLIPLKNDRGGVGSGESVGVAVAAEKESIVPGAVAEAEMLYSHGALALG